MGLIVFVIIQRKVGSLKKNRKPRTGDELEGGRLDADVQLRVLVDDGVRAGDEPQLEVAQQRQAELGLQQRELRQVRSKRS